jgi:hypothetical protein
MNQKETDLAESELMYGADILKVLWIAITIANGHTVPKAYTAEVKRRAQLVADVHGRVALDVVWQVVKTTMLGRLPEDN